MMNEAGEYLEEVGQHDILVSQMGKAQYISDLMEAYAKQKVLEHDEIQREKIAEVTKEVIQAKVLEALEKEVPKAYLVNALYAEIGEKDYCEEQSNEYYKTEVEPKYKG